MKKPIFRALLILIICAVGSQAGIQVHLTDHSDGSVSLGPYDCVGHIYSIVDLSKEPRIDGEIVARWRNPNGIIQEKTRWNPGEKRRIMFWLEFQQPSTLTTIDFSSTESPNQQHQGNWTFELVSESELLTSVPFDVQCSG